MLLSFHIFYHQDTSIIWVLWKSFVEITFFNNIKVHFQKSLTKPKLKIGSNGFLIWVSWHSCLKKNNVSWLPWFEMAIYIYIYIFIFIYLFIYLFLWHNLTFDAFCGSFDYVLTPWCVQLWECLAIYKSTKKRGKIWYSPSFQRSIGC